jgi:predicted methyltransferase
MLRTATVTAGAALAISLALGAEGAPAIPAYITAAVADTARPQADTERDAERKPADMLAFAGVKPGAKVVDLLPGGGYFTRLFSAAVGPQGKVYALAPARPETAPADAPDRAAAVKAIAADPHYGNVTVISQPAKQLLQFSLPEPVDVVWTSQNYHDLHNIPDTNVLDFDKVVFQALKPGGVYIVLDHAAEAGSGFRDTSTLHRIDEAAVKKEVEAAGFKFEGASTVLRNKDDPHTAKVFDSSIRGHTDQFILKFRKPK